MHKNKVQLLVGCRIRVLLLDGRSITGQLLAYDKYLNVVLADCDETRPLRKKQTSGPPSNAEATRSMGMLVLRGENVVTMTPENYTPVTSANKARVPASMQIVSGNKQ